jgi:hypothetical protein
MDRPSQNAADFIRKLTEMVYRLAARDIVIASLHADWSSFGCWQLQAQRGAEAVRYAEALRGRDPMRAPGPEVVRVFWDGRDGVLSVEASPTRFCSAPNEWKSECNKGFDRTDDGLFQFVEDYLVRRLGA